MGVRGTGGVRIKERTGVKAVFRPIVLQLAAYLGFSFCTHLHVDEGPGQ